MTLPLLVYARHRPEYLDGLLAALEHEDVNGKTVMLEIDAFPYTCYVDPDFAQFYNTVGAWFVGRGGRVLCGDDHNALLRASRFRRGLENRMRKSRHDHTLRRRLLAAWRDVVPFFERDPEFLRFAQTHDPDYIILGANHLPTLIENAYAGLRPYRTMFVPVRANEFFELPRIEIHDVLGSATPSGGLARRMDRESSRRTPA